MSTLHFLIHLFIYLSVSILVHSDFLLKDAPTLFPNQSIILFIDHVLTIILISAAIMYVVNLVAGH